MSAIEETGLLVLDALHKVANQSKDLELNVLVISESTFAACGCLSHRDIRHALSLP